jgi:hypothetical protein
MVTRSTKQTLKKEAQRVADLWETASQRKKSAQHIRAVFSEIYRDIYGQSLPVTSMKGFADLWVNEKKPSTAPATQLAYEKTVAAFLEHLGTKRAEADIADVSRTDIVAFRDSLYARKLAADTINRLRKSFTLASLGERIAIVLPRQSLLSRPV